MCGRYYVDDVTSKEIEKLIGQSVEVPVLAGDIHPTDLAPVLVGNQGALGCRMLRWGMPGYHKGGSGKGSVIFNARSESALEKPSFREGLQNRRVVIPATWFYEWNKRKEKNVFRRTDSPVLYMAGCYNHYGDGDRFVILTTEANRSMLPVHDRMPLILEREEVSRWILDGTKTAELLKKVPCLLERKNDYEQMSLF